jgi:ribonuclease HII
MLRHEREAWSAGRRRVGGVDEAGRGPWAGPVVAVCVVLDPAFAVREEHGRLDGLTDSKRLSPRRRETFDALLRSLPEAAFGLGLASVEEIDRLNILRATHLAMARAVAALPRPPDFLLVDGRPVPGLPVPSAALVGGDGLSLSIAAASVLAKVARDRIMNAMDAECPGYGFAAHKGYGTAAHHAALLRLGPCPHHRRSFRPVRERAAAGAPHP